MVVKDCKTAQPLGHADTLPCRPNPMPTARIHALSGLALMSEGFEPGVFGLGWFWGEKRKFWRMGRVWLAMVGHVGGFERQTLWRGHRGHRPGTDVTRPIGLWVAAR